ncbi:MAG TPA: transglutaminase domain-containing protein [Candidatus Dormibacteraeota bacterium]|jgi:hypothetical protein|nr:transglutaminase domain-containing protein [Candidatus Dormibacteraeota bacterium]
MSERWRFLDQLPTLGLGVLAAIVVAASTVASGWVPGLDSIVPVSIVAVVFVGGLAMLPFLGVWAVLGLSIVAAPAAALLAFGGPALHSGVPGMFRPLGRWANDILLGDGFGDLTFVHAQIAGLFWIAAAWFAWCLMRWRQPLLALIPGTAVIATNALNHPNGQNGYIVGYGAVICFLLLWTSYRRSLSAATRRVVRLGSDVRVDFWTTGGLLTVAVILIAAILPPMSNTNRTVTIQNGMFQSWAELEGQIASLGPFSNGQVSIGFTFNAELGGPLQESQTPIFAYSATGDAANPFYFQGVTMTATRDGEWQFDSGGDDVAQPAGQTVHWEGSTHGEVAETFSIHMLHPVGQDPVLLPFSGRLTTVSRPTILVAPRQPGRRARASGDGILSLDELEAQAAGRSDYEFESDFSIATSEQLREASTDYPAWLDSYRNFTNSATAAPGHWSADGYRSAQVLTRIHDLAMTVTQGADNPYDEASAIEAYLRDGNIYSYSLNPKAPPQGTDPLAYFLFQSHQGYCQYFASAMGDMLRSLGLPVRLVSGFTGGTYSFADNDYVVRSGDAHMWVQVYFPGYGWINFDPTPNGFDQAPAGGPQPGRCPECGQATPNPHPTSASPTARPSSHPAPPGGGSGGGSSSVPSWLAPLMAGLGSAGGAALLVLLFVAWLRPRSLDGVWRRSLRLSGLAGIRLDGGDTPGEVGERIALVLPQAAAPARRLAGCVAVAAYAPPWLAAGEFEGAMAAWRELRPHLLRGWLRRLLRRSP